VTFVRHTVAVAEGFWKFWCSFYLWLGFGFGIVVVWLRHGHIISTGGGMVEVDWGMSVVVGGGFLILKFTLEGGRWTVKKITSFFARADWEGWSLWLKKA